jgi:hypothetical protein
VSDWITVTEATQVARVHDSWIRALVKQGVIRQREAPPGQHGHAGRCTVLVHRDDVLEQGRRHQPATGAPAPPKKPRVPLVGETVIVRRPLGAAGLPGKGSTQVAGKVFAVTKRFAVIQFPSGVREAFHFREIKRRKGVAS